MLLVVGGGTEIDVFYNFLLSGKQGVQPRRSGRNQ
jgi:hypothetical protein